MFFCPDCEYTLDLSKNTDKDNKDKKIINNITQISSLLNEFEDSDNDFIKNHLFKIEENKLFGLPEFNSLNEKKKNIIKNNIIDNQYTSNIIFICKNCDYTEKIRQTFRLYQSDNNLKNKILPTSLFYPKAGKSMCQEFQGFNKNPGILWPKK